MKTQDFFRVPGLGAKKKNAVDPKYATFNRRMMAATIDTFLLMFCAPLFNMVAPVNTSGLIDYEINYADPHWFSRLLITIMSNHAFMTTWLYSTFLQYMLFCIFSALCWYKWSATPGKLLFGIRVVDATTHARMSNQQIVIRLLGYLVSSLGLFMGFFWIGLDKRRQGWHDKLANTVVVVNSRIKRESQAVDPSNSPAPSTTE